MLELADCRQEENFDCGAAAVKTVCELFGIRKSRESLIKLLGTNRINGTDPRTVEAFLRGESLRVVSGEMTLADLNHFTRRGAPVLCLVTLNRTGHYIVVGGVRRNKVYFQDPDVGPRHLATNEFLERWVDFDRFGLNYINFGLAVWK